MLSTAFVLGSCTIWSMHFIGMHAVSLKHTQICYDWGETFASLALTIAGVWMGIFVTNFDVFSGADRVYRLKQFLQGNSAVSSKLDRNKASRQIHIVALFYHLHWIALGSVFVALGALSMHYLGMYAMKGPFRREWNVGYIVASVFHEWGHYLGARISGAQTTRTLPKNLTNLFRFSFDFGSNSATQFHSMSFGGWAIGLYCC